MTRRVTVILALVLVIVLGASLTTVDAYQASTADRAQLRFDSAQRQAAALIRQARIDGLNSTELAPLQVRRAAITAGRPPASWAFFHPGLASFYTHQSRALSALDASIKQAVHVAALQRRVQASDALNRLRASIATAQRLQSPAGTAPAVLAAAITRFRAATLPVDFARVSAEARQAAGALSVSYAAEQRYVTTVVAHTHGSIRSLHEQTSSQITEARSHLPLLGYLTHRAQAYGARLASLGKASALAPTATAAAIADWRAHQLAATVLADYSKTVPAKLIVVSTETQSVRVYQNGKVVLTTPATTGGPELPTGRGVFHIYFKASPFVFHSPFPPSSPYYYYPTPIQYWMPFDGQEGLHDASWRNNFGPGSNFQPTDLGTGHDILGTHGCVNLPLSAAAFIWNFAPVGTTVVVR